MKKILFIACAAALLAACTEMDDPGIKAKIDISVAGSSDSTSLKILFAPDERTAWFEYAIGGENDLSAFQDGSLEGITRVDGNSSEEVLFEGLEPSTYYSIFAKAYTSDGVSGGTNVLKVSTLDTRFHVELQYLLDDVAGFKVWFPQEFYQCRYYLGSAADKEAFLSGEIEGEYLVEISNYQCVNYTDLKPQTEYVFYAIGEDRKGAKTELWEIPAVTCSSEECPNVAVSTDIDVYQGTYTISPNSHCGKIIGFVSLKGGIGDYYGGFNYDFISMFESWATSGWLNTATSSGSEPLVLTYVTPDMWNDVELELFVVIGDSEGNSAGVKRYSFSTPSFDESLALPNPGKIEVSSISNAGAVYTMEADETAIGYFYETVDADWYDDLKASDPQWSEHYLADTFYSNYSENNAAGYLHYGIGQHVYAETAGKSDYRYYAAIVPFNGNGPQEGGWGETTLVEYRTLAE